ncbi:hypothetical protein AVEN_86491-1 [Araneus ventricosus]|uniref:Uncharacterized protein n=1 Tax=Araneus ventricosus TaxID=182803 RepID=A0A4Y2UMS4_ARAVE|nr:hypothetical protein AVEN_86491-1 [Araneus ventricosus]
MTPGLPLLSPSFLTTPEGGCLTHIRFNMLESHKRGRFSVESGFEPGIFRLRIRDLTTSGANLWHAYPWGNANDQLGVRELKVGNGRHLKT